MIELTRVKWKYTDKKIRDKYIKEFLKLFNEMSFFMNTIDRGLIKKNTASTEKELIDYLEYYEKINRDICLYFFEEELVAYTMIKASKYYKKRLDLEELFVTKNFRKKGFGSYILDDTIKIAKELKLSNVGLHVSTNNKPARDLYIKKGFKTIAEDMLLAIENINNKNQIFYYLDLANEDMNISISSTNKKLEDLTKEVKFSIEKFKAIEDFTITDSVVDIFQYLYKCNEFFSLVLEKDNIDLDIIESYKSKISNNEHRVRTSCTVDKIKDVISDIEVFCSEIRDKKVSSDLEDAIKGILVNLPKELNTLIKVIKINIGQEKIVKVEVAEEQFFKYFL